MKVTHRINFYKGIDGIYDGRARETLDESLAEATFSEDAYLHTVVYTDHGQHVAIYSKDDLSISACENGPLSGGGDCECGHHEYSRVDDDIGMGGWFWP